MRERILVIGAGSIGRRHAANLLKLGCKDIVLYDPSAESLAQAPKECRKAQDFERALVAGCAVALICSPPHLHIAQALRCLEKGMDIFIEKPLSHSLDGVDALIALARAQGRVVMTACNLRFSPTFAQVKKLVDRRALGAPRSVRILFGGYLPNWRSQSDYRSNYAARKETGGGVILDAGVHEIDFVRWLFGPARVCAAYASRQGTLDIETEDSADIILKHRSGPVSAIHVDYLRQEYAHQGEVLCEHGTIAWDFAANTVTVHDARTGKRSIKNFGGPNTGERANAMYVEEMRHFLQCVRTRAKPLADAEEGKHALVLALEARKSVEVGA